jgi:hypothetical protein
MNKPEPDYSDINPWTLLLFSIAYLSFVWSSIGLLVAIFGG